MVQDANGHQAAALTGGLGKTNYKQTYTGTSGSYTLYATTTLTYNAASDLLSTKSPDGTTVMTTYDALGRAISQQDPDSGTSTVSYDPNGNVTETVDARGNTGTIYAGYDGLNRQLWRNSTNSATGAWITNSYDNTANGNVGVGRLTGESFTGSGNLSGSYAYTYDARGQQTNQTTTINGTQYAVQATYNDAGMLLSQQYPTGETVTPSYSSTGWLSGLNTSTGGSTALASNLAYTGLSGAAGRISSMSLGNGTYSYTASYDTGIRLTSAGLSTSSGNNTLYQTQPTYDAVNNVVGVQTSVGGQTDTQQFCYDDLNRLTWAGTNGTPPCSGQSVTAGTLTSAQYQQSTSYNVDGGLVSGPSGTYTYGDSTHPHAVTSTSNGYSAAYDASGNMTCRATTTASTCSGSSPTGQQLSYDAEGRLSLWQNQPTSPTQTVNYLYDGSGNRVAMQSTVSGTTTLTSYIGSIEEVQTSGSSTQTTTYYAVEGKRIAADVNGTFYYFGYDALGSQVAVLDTAGHVVGAQLYSPYGASRYNNGTLPTSIGFTGQRADSVTGLDYYVARYYDPNVGQFLSADSVQGNKQGMDPYAYVGGNPETRMDPSGHRFIAPDGSTAWINPDGNIYRDTPGGSVTVIGHTHSSWPISGNGGRGYGSSGSGTGHSNPKITRSTSTGCNAACGRRDRTLILNKITNVEEGRVVLQATAVSDGLALVSDGIAAALDAAASDWSGFAAEVVSTVARVAALTGDLAKLGVFSLPPQVSDFLQLMKVVANIVDTVEAFVNLVNPVASLAKEAATFATQIVKPAVQAGIAQLVASTASAGVGVGTQKVIDVFHYDGLREQVSGYTDQQAHDACLHQYMMDDPGQC